MICNIMIGLFEFIRIPKDVIYVDRVAIILLMLAALVPTYSLAIKEFKEFNWRE